MFFFLQQPSDPAVLSMSEAQAPTQQQKNIFQVNGFHTLDLWKICKAMPAIYH